MQHDIRPHSFAGATLPNLSLCSPVKQCRVKGLGLDPLPQYVAEVCQPPLLGLRGVRCLFVALRQPFVFPPQLWRGSAPVPVAYEFPVGLCRPALAERNAAACILPLHRPLQSSTLFSAPETFFGFTSCLRASAGFTGPPGATTSLLYQVAGLAWAFASPRDVG